jgi:hypothetical protein
VALIVAQRIVVMQQAEYKTLSDEFRALYSRDDMGRDLVRNSYPFINKWGEKLEEERED